MENQTQEQNNPVAIYNKALPLFQNGGQILAANRELSGKIIAKGQEILNQLQAKAAKGEEMTADDDKLLNDYIVKVNQRVKEMNAARAPITQMMTAVAKLYTAEENAPAEILRIMQEFRNNYAKQVAEAQRKIEQEARDRQAKTQEAIDIRTNCESQLLSSLRQTKEQEKDNLYKAFNTITLDAFEGRKASLLAYEPKIGESNVQQFSFGWNYKYHSPDEFREIVEGVKAVAPVEPLKQYVQELLEAKQSLVDRLPSKLSELQELAKAGEEEAKRLEEQRKAREEREEQERRDLEQRQQEEQQQQLQAKSVAESTLAMFTAEAEVAQAAPEAPETRQGYEITVTNAVGWMEIFNLWFTHEGKNLSIEKIGSTKMDSMKTWAEKHAHKTSEKIESKFLSYMQVFKAVNRKAKAEA